MNKEQKEKWIIKEFLRIYNRKFNEDYKVIRKIPQKVAPGPDFIINNTAKNKKGIEVTELFEYPSAYTGQQQYLESLFFERLESRINKAKFKNYSFDFYFKRYPKSKQKLIKYRDRVIKQIDEHCNNKAMMINNSKIKLIVDKQTITVRFDKNRKDGPHFNCHYDIDRYSFSKGLRERIKEKNKSVQKYLKNQPNSLVIYDNTDYGAVLSDKKQNIFRRLNIIYSSDFEKIWFLTNQNIFEIKQ